MPKVVIDPVTRIEGHLRVTCEVQDGQVVNAWNHATQFRGFEIFMQGRNPLDAWQFAQRICGVCPTPHAHASTLATEHAMGYEAVPDNARIIRNMFETTHVGYDHILWLYILAAFDYVNVPEALNASPTTPGLEALQAQLLAVVESGQLGPFAGHWWDHPGYALDPDQNLELVSHYLQAIEIQQVANDAQAFMGGRFPMVMSFIPGGMQERPEIEQIQYYIGAMEKVKTFVDTVMLPDLLALAGAYGDLATHGQGVGNYLSWGLYDDESQDPVNRVFPAGIILNRDLNQVYESDLNQVRMYTAHSWYPDEIGEGRHPLDVGQEPRYTELTPLDSEQDPTGKYDWTQAARYGEQNLPMEVGPLAEMLVTYAAGRDYAVSLVDNTLAAIGQEGNPGVLMSNLGRVAARVLREKINVDFAYQWAQELLDNYSNNDFSVYDPRDIPDEGVGAGGWNAPRGALAHYMRIEGGEIGAYAAVPPTNWNLSPRDDFDVPGPLEQTLVGVPVEDPERPLEILRTIHTFDP